MDGYEELNKKEALDYLSEDSSKKYLLPYLTREINWIVISILSASYVSSLVLMRSVFELTVGIATRHTSTMSERIDRIALLTELEKKDIKKLWYRLCAWGHPYGKWLKEVCPIYSDHQPLYHTKLCTLCLEELTNIVDLFLVVIIFKYEVEQSNAQKKLNELGIEVSAFELLGARFSA